MGSGCSGNNINGYFGTPIPDKGVKYTGPSIPALDICTGDFLNEIEAIIFAKLLEFMEGKGIQVPEINLNECPFIQEFITCCSEDKSLEKLFTILFKAICSLKTDLTSLEDRVDEVLNITFNLRCLTVSNPTIGNVINEIIREFCLLKTRVEVLEATVIDLQRQIDELTLSITETITDLINSIIDTRIGNYLLNHIFSCNGFGLYKTGSGSTATLQFNGMVPPMCPIPYVGPLSNFDNTGIGLYDKGYCGWFICNGLNNTPDMRGYTFASATTGVTGGGLDAKVSPFPTNYLEKVGEQKVVLTTAELPSTGTSSGSLTLPAVYETNNQLYSASVPGDGGTYRMAGGVGAATNYKDLARPNPSKAGPQYNFTATPEPPLSSSQGTFEFGLVKGYRPSAFWESKGAVRTVTVGSTGSGGGENQPHENRQATYHGVWIMRFN